MLVDGMNPRKATRRMIRRQQGPIEYDPPGFASEGAGKVVMRREVVEMEESTKNLVYHELGVRLLGIKSYLMHASSLIQNFLDSYVTKFVRFPNASP